MTTKKALRKSPAFQFYPSDFLMDINVQVMSNQQKGCYITLLSICWREGWIWSDVETIALLCHEPLDAMAKMWPAIARCFVPMEGVKSKLVHPRLQKESQKQMEFHAKQRIAGQRGAAKRWGTKVEEDAVAKPAPRADQPDIVIAKQGGLAGNDGQQNGKGAPAAKAAPPVCPHQEIVAMYHEILSDLPKITSWPEHRQKQLAKRWRESPERQSLAWWSDYFVKIKDSDFLMGRSTDFKADIDWIMGPKNFLKIVEGRYVNRVATPKPVAPMTQVNNGPRVNIPVLN